MRKGTAKFATDGKSLVVNGHNVEITLTYTWNDIPVGTNNLCDGSYLLELKVNNASAGCSIMTQYFTIAEG